MPYPLFFLRYSAYVSGGAARAISMRRLMNALLPSARSQTPGTHLPRHRRLRVGPRMDAGGGVMQAEVLALQTAAERALAVRPHVHP